MYLEDRTVRLQLWVGVKFLKDMHDGDNNVNNLFSLLIIGHCWTGEI